MKKLIFLFLLFPFFANAQANKEQQGNEQALKAMLGKTYIKKSTNNPYLVVAYVIAEDEVLIQQKGVFTLGYDTLVRSKFMKDFRLPEMVECPLCHGRGKVVKDVYVATGYTQIGNQSIANRVTTEKVVETCGKCDGTGKVEEASDIQLKNFTIIGAVEAKPKISSINIPIFSLSAYPANKKLPVTSNKLSSNFYNQFKALLTAYLEDVKGDYLGKHEEGGKTYTLYASKKNLDGFGLAALNLNEKENLWIVAGTIKDNPNNAQLFEQITAELNKLKSEGYSLVDMTNGVTNAATYIQVVKEGKRVGYYLLLKSNDIQVFFTPKNAPSTTPTGVPGLVWFTSSASVGKYGLMDSATQTVLIQPKYDKVNKFADGMALVSRYDSYMKRTEYGYVDKTGKVAIPLSSRWGVLNYIPHNFSEGLALVWIEGWTYIDKTGKAINSPYNMGDGKDFSEGLAAVSEYNNGLGKKQWGFIDKTGKYVIASQYDEAESFTNGKAKVKKGTQEFFIDKTGNMITDNATGNANSEGWFVGGQSLFGYKDGNGKVVIQPKYIDVRPFKEGLAAVAVKSSYGTPLWFFVDNAGKEIAQSNSKDIKGNLGYGEVSDFSEGLAAVKGYGGKWGFIDKTGKEVIKLKYENVQSFNDGIAWVEYKGDWGLIDQTEKVLLPFCYNQAISLGEGLYKVKYNYEKLKKEAKKYDALKEVMSKNSVSGVTKGYILDGGIIDKTGKELKLKNYYQEFRPFSEGLAAVKYSLWGYIDTSGKEVIDGYYLVAGDFKDGKAKVKDERGREFYIDKTGKEIK